MTSILKQQTMNAEEIKMKMILAAKAKLNQHNLQGNTSRLSIIEVAELRDIIAGNFELNLAHSAQFYGLHSLN